MSSLNQILDGLPRAVVLEALYLASHELTCSTRMTDLSVAQNKALTLQEAEEASQLATRIIEWCTTAERKPLATFSGVERARSANKLASYRRHNLTKFSTANRAAARKMLDRLSLNAY